MSTAVPALLTCLAALPATFAAGSNSLSVLRTARLLRVFKLARSWAELNRIITTILKSFSQVMYLSLLLMLFMFVFALMVSAQAYPAQLDTRQAHASTKCLLSLCLQQLSLVGVVVPEATVSARAAQPPVRCLANKFVCVCAGGRGCSCLVSSFQAAMLTEPRSCAHQAHRRLSVHSTQTATCAARRARCSLGSM